MKRWRVTTITRKKDKELAARVSQLLKEKGTQALDMAKQAILEKEFASEKVRKAAVYFSEYWCDLARPTLISICCESVGGKVDIATPIAASITLICGATDIHDDIIDKSKKKMARPTILGKFGKDIALLVGDALFFEGFLLLHKACKNITMEKSVKVYQVVSDMFFELGNAEALELQFRGRTDVVPEKYLSILNMKAADVEACTKIGAIVGGGSEKEIDALGKYGRTLGSIMILRDDLADATDYEELSNRIKHEPLPLPILLAMQNPEIKLEICNIISKKKVRKGDVEKISKLIRSGGIEQKIIELIKTMNSDAHLHIRRIPNNQNLDMLAYAVTFL